MKLQHEAFRRKSRRGNVGGSLYSLKWLSWEWYKAVVLKTHQKILEGGLKHRLLRPTTHSEFVTQQAQSKTPESAFLTSFQLLMLLAQRSDFRTVGRDKRSSSKP